MNTHNTSSESVNSKNKSEDPLEFIWTNYIEKAGFKTVSIISQSQSAFALSRLYARHSGSIEDFISNIFYTQISISELKAAVKMFSHGP